MLKAIIFDVDGVLVDSKESNIFFYQKLLANAGYHDIPRDVIIDNFHLTMRQTIEKLIGSKDQKEIQRIFSLATDPSLRDSDLMMFPEKLEDLLEELHKKYRLAIVTGRVKFGVEDIFTVKKIGHLFDVVVAFEDYINPKPHPEPLLIALKKLGLNANEAIYIGDSPTDIEAAKAANMRSIFLSENPHVDAIARISGLKELREAIEKLLSTWPK